MFSDRVQHASKKRGAAMVYKNGIHKHEHALVASYDPLFPHTFISVCAKDAQR